MLGWVYHTSLRPDFGGVLYYSIPVTQDVLCVALPFALFGQVESVGTLCKSRLCA